MPLMQVSSLLQSRKSKADVTNIVEICSSLTTAQVLKIIKSYRMDDCEDATAPVSIDELAAELNERPNKVIFHMPNRNHQKLILNSQLI